VPLFWTLLPKAGNAKTDERIAILKKLREVFADQPLGSLMDDREFIGVAWMGWLRNAGIFLFCVCTKTRTFSTIRPRRVPCLRARRLCSPGRR
jgi:hypothetical protein